MNLLNALKAFNWDTKTISQLWQLVALNLKEELVVSYNNFDSHTETDVVRVLG